MLITINHSSKKLSRIPYKSYNILILNKEGFPLTGAALCLRIYLDWLFTLEIRGFPEEKEANKVYCGGYANWELSLSYDVTAAILVFKRMKTVPC